MTLDFSRHDFRLRDVTLEDAQTLFTWRCSPRIASMMLQPPPTSFEAHLSYLCRIVANPCTHALYMLEHLGRPVGHVALKVTAADSRLGDWSIYVGEVDAPRGTGFALGVMSLDRVFARPEFRTLQTTILSRNLASQRLHARLGFDCEMLPQECAQADSGVWTLEIAKWRQIRISVFQAAFRVTGAG